MVKYCCAYNCTAEQITGCGLKFHSFPLKEPERLAKWTNAVKRENFKPNKHTKLCSRHFHATDYYETACNTIALKKDAVPSIFDYPPHLEKMESDRRILVRFEDFDVNIDIPETCAVPETLTPKMIDVSTQTTLTGELLWEKIRNCRREKKVLQQRVNRQNKKINELQSLLKLLKEK